MRTNNIKISVIDSEFDAIAENIVFNYKEPTYDELMVKAQQRFETEHKQLVKFFLKHM